MNLNRKKLCTCPVSVYVAWLYSVFCTVELIWVDKWVPLSPGSFMSGNLGQCYARSFTFSVTEAWNLCQATRVKLFGEHSCASDGRTGRLQIWPEICLAADGGVCKGARGCTDPTEVLGCWSRAGQVSPIQGSMELAAPLLLLQAGRWSWVFPTSLSTAAHLNTKGKTRNSTKPKFGEWEAETTLLKISQTVSLQYNLRTAIFADRAGGKQRWQRVVWGETRSWRANSAFTSAQSGPWWRKSWSLQQR